MEWVLYFLVINVIGFGMMGVDKQRAKKGEWRISERTLFLLVFAGGAVGIYIGMKWFRHKTKHASFTQGVPGIFLLQIMILAFIIFFN
ncbi:DUF1294 domain-containing protein [Halalkalibacter nanhaiisediminis]|uniref:DUF1294 domain-containing protein n=1 Tax=Halalkalibacter nanhaiisediminis TaxID=688079 RepID=A0A562QJT2_9BACI|nr:DUF1294 domain-containing protein [Halalkalibacter nanhaiisediminis]TWI57012.1 hypothetical protein IQ10_01710 [Halalkalibacter nanhaiisediminis]